MTVHCEREEKRDALTQEAEAFVRRALSHRAEHKVSDAAIRAAAVKISKRLFASLGALSAGREEVEG